LRRSDDWRSSGQSRDAPELHSFVVGLPDIGYSGAREYASRITGRAVTGTKQTVASANWRTVDAQINVR